MAAEPDDHPVDGSAAGPAGPPAQAGENEPDQSQASASEIPDAVGRADRLLAWLKQDPDEPRAAS